MTSSLKYKNKSWGWDGEPIRQWRLEQRMSQRELARITGIAPSKLCRYERNQLVPRATDVYALFRVTHLVDELFYRKGE